MTATRGLLAALRRLLASPPPASPGRRFELRNLTRGTCLATGIVLADSAARRSRGLLGRGGLVPGEGLWIVPCEAVHTFGMRFPIDLVYLDRRLTVRKIRRNVRPWRLSACIRAHSVVELARGAVGDQDARPGDLLAFTPVAGRSDAAFPVRVAKHLR